MQALRHKAFGRVERVCRHLCFKEDPSGPKRLKFSKGPTDKGTQLVLEYGTDQLFWEVSTEIFKA